MTIRAWLRQPLVQLAIIVIAALIAFNVFTDYDTGPTKTADQVRTEVCERSWTDSPGTGSKQDFMERCKDGLKEMEGAAR